MILTGKEFSEHFRAGRIVYKRVVRGVGWPACVPTLDGEEIVIGENEAFVRQNTLKTT